MKTLDEKTKRERDRQDPDPPIQNPSAPSRLPPGYLEVYGIGKGGVVAEAARGVAGFGAPLPYLAEIQRAFGHHDVSAVRAHLDVAAVRAAEALGAVAYAHGDHVAFADAPSLHLAAHEAAHVIQQRHGASSGPLSHAGDRSEAEADRVADLVVAGQSAEEILDGHAPSGPAGPTVQRREAHIGPFSLPGTKDEDLSRYKAFLLTVTDYALILDVTRAVKALLVGTTTEFDQQAYELTVLRHDELKLAWDQRQEKRRLQENAAQHSPPSTSMSFGFGSCQVLEPGGSLFDFVSPSQVAEKKQVKEKPPGSEERNSALEEAYTQLAKLGFDSLTHEEQHAVWEQVLRLQEAFRLWACLSQKDWKNPDLRHTHFGLLFSPFRTPTDLLAHTNEYNELNVDTTPDGVEILSVFILDRAAHDLLDDPFAFGAKHQALIRAMKAANHCGMRICVADHDSAAEQSGPRGKAPKGGVSELGSDLGADCSDLKSTMMGPEQQAWTDHTLQRRAELASGDTRPHTVVAGVLVYRAPMALITRVKIDEKSDKEFFVTCLKSKRYPDGSRGFRCASLIGADATVMDGEIGFELAAEPHRLKAMGAEDLQAPDPAGDGARMKEYLQLTERAQIVAQYVRLQAK